MNVLFLTEDDLRTVLSEIEPIEPIEQAFRSLSEGNANQ